MSQKEKHVVLSENLLNRLRQMDKKDADYDFLHKIFDLGEQGLNILRQLGWKTGRDVNDQPLFFKSVFPVADIDGWSVGLLVGSRGLEYVLKTGVIYDVKYDEGVTVASGEAVTKQYLCRRYRGLKDFREIADLIKSDDLTLEVYPDLGEGMGISSYITLSPELAKRLKKD